MAKYSVNHVQRAIPHDRDATAMLLRVLRDGDYYQAFQVIVSGSFLRLQEPVPGDAFWMTVGRLAGEAIENIVRGGFEPLADPSQAVRLDVDAAAAFRASRQGDPLDVLSSTSTQTLHRFEM